MLSKAAVLKQDCTENEDDSDVPMTTETQVVGTTAVVDGDASGDVIQDNMSVTVEGGNDEEGANFHVFWQRDPERERDKILGFFVMDGQPIPRELFHLIMQFVPAFPFYFMLRSVCSQWLYEFQEQIYGNVTFLSLVDDGRPKYYFRDNGQTLVQFKPIGASGKKFSLDQAGQSRYYNRTPVFKFLANVFPNVKHLKLGLGSFTNRYDLTACFQSLVAKLTQIETLDILGATLTRSPTLNRRHWKNGSPLSVSELEVIARSLSSSLKSLNFIGVSLSTHSIDALKLFSEKGRTGTSVSNSQFSTALITVDIQRLTLHSIFLLQHSLNMNSSEWERIKEVYPDFELTVVESDDNTLIQQATTVSYVDYLNYMSKKEGIFLACIGTHLRTDTDEAVEAIIDTAVREYPYFQPLLSLPGKVFQLVSRVKLNGPFIASHVQTALKALELLTDPIRMKYPELVMDVNSKFNWYANSPPTTLLGILIPIEGAMELLPAIIETYKPSLTVNGTRNYLVEIFTNASHLRRHLMDYFLSLEPELIVLGNSEGTINNEEKKLPLIQLFLSRDGLDYTLDDIKYLVKAGASLTHVDKSGSNVLHSACLTLDVDLVQYLLSVCPESMLFERNTEGQTPLELIFSPNKNDILLHTFLEAASKWSIFQDRKLSSYKTSCGNLLHSALANPSVATIRWLLAHGFEANALNDREENALFYSRTESKKQIHSYSSQYRTYDTMVSLDHYIDPYAEELIKAGAKVDLENIDRRTIITSALRNSNYQLINYIIQNPDISSKPLAVLLGPRMQHGFNALHFVFKTMVDIADPMKGMNKKQKAFTVGNYPIARHCALLCLEHYPEMLYERSEPSDEEDLKGICGLSPLQILLEASKGLPLLNDLSINLRDIANKPVFASKDPNVIAPIPVLYLALEVALDIPMFDRLMTDTDNVLIRDETQETKPNLLHIAAERDASLCQCIIRHWKKKFKVKEELLKLINQPLENDAVDGRKPRNATMIACHLGIYERFAILWPYTQAVAEQFDCPAQIALDNNDHQFALYSVLHHAILPTKDQLHRIIRKCLSQRSLTPEVYETKFVTLMMQTEEKQTKPSWLELLTQAPSDAVDSEEHYRLKGLSTLQLMVLELANYMFGWLVRHYCDDPLLNRAVRTIDIRTGDTLLHMLTSSTKSRASIELSSILSSIVNQFTSDGAPVDKAQKFSKRTKVKLPSIEHLNTKELTEFVNIQNKFGRTCLHNVSANSLSPILQDLLVLGANTELRDSQGKTPQELITKESLTDIVTKFLNKRDGKKPQKRKQEYTVYDTEDDEEHSSSTKKPRKKRKTTKK